MKKQKWKEWFGHKGMYAFLIAGVFIAMTAVLISVNNQSADEQGQNQLVDLNEEPNQLTGESNITENDYASLEKENAPDANKPTKDQTDKDQPSKPQVETPIQKDNVTNAENAAKTPTNNTVADKQTGKETAVNTSVVESKPVLTMTVASLKFQPEEGLSWPLKGNIIMDYSDDRTVFHQTLLQFRTNPAILIGGTAGTEVIAPKQGIVASVENRPETGNTITIDIGNGYRLVYGQLEETGWKAGDVVDAGEVVGRLAKVSRYYSVEGDHLYFQVLNVDTPIDPSSVLKQE